MAQREVVELVGVYNADGGPVGEARYVIGKLLGRAHCALCDVTHSPVRRKPEWDRMVGRLGVPVILLHRNEAPADVVTAVAASGTAAVLARTSDGTLLSLLGPADLEEMQGSVARFEDAVAAALSVRDLVLAPA